MNNFDVNILIEATPSLIEGVKTTLFISGISSVCAFLIGLAAVFFRTMGRGVVKFLATAYVEVIRNTPLLVQLYIVYKALPGIGVQFDPVFCGILALSIYTGAFISEVLRSGINSITTEQYMAARGLGLSHLQAFKMIIFPQAIRIVIPPLGSQFINLVKNSSLVSFIAVTDVFYVIYKGAVDDFRFFEFFIIGAIIYMSLTGIVAFATNMLEKYTRIPGRTVKA